VYVLNCLVIGSDSANEAKELAQHFMSCIVLRANTSCVVTLSTYPDATSLTIRFTGVMGEDISLLLRGNTGFASD